MSIVTDEQLREMFKNIDGDDYPSCLTNSKTKKKNLEQTIHNPNFRKIAIARSTDSDFQEDPND